MTNVLYWQEAVTVVESAYNNYANATQRAAMAAEFYGKTFFVFRVREQYVSPSAVILMSLSPFSTSSSHRVRYNKMISRGGGE